MKSSLKKTSKYIETKRVIDDLRKDEDNDTFDASTITSESSYLDPYIYIYFYICIILIILAIN